MLALIQQQIHGPSLEVLVHTAVGNLIDPPADLDVGRAGIKVQSALFQPGLQRVHETVPQVAVEPLDLSLGLGAIRLAQQRPEAEMPGHIPQGRMKTMLARTVGIPLQYHGAHVVVEHLFGHPFKELERMLVTASKHLEAFTGHELDVGSPACAQSRHEGGKRVLAAPDDVPVDLHLLAVLGLKTLHDFRDFHGLERSQEVRTDRSQPS